MWRSFEDVPLSVYAAWVLILKICPTQGNQIISDSKYCQKTRKILIARIRGENPLGFQLVKKLDAR